MATEFSFDPATGQRGAGFPPPGMGNPAGQSSVQWMPPADLQSSDPHEDPSEVGDEPPTTAEVPSNIHRSADEDWDGDDGFGSDDFDGSLDGDDDPHDADCIDTSDGTDDCDDCGDVAGNIVIDAGHRSYTPTPGPFSRSKLGL
jgi:hypothetical protein